MFVKLCLFFILATFGACVNYEGYTVYNIFSKNELQNDFLQTLKDSTSLDFWSPINRVGNPVTVLVPPDAKSNFEKKLQSYNISYTVKIPNVQRTIDSENRYHRNKAVPKGSISFDQYLKLEEINAYLEQLATDYPDLVTLQTIGQSYENRTMKIIKFSKDNKPKPVIFIEAGMHAREWISPALSVFIINQLVESIDGLHLLDGLDWIILPNMNPDGYEYTWTTNRHWRKTRSAGTTCNGTDGNRNFGFHWMENGASDDECSEIFAGKSAFSEKEAQNLRDALNATENIAAFVSLHSYGQVLFYPYSYDNVKPDNWEELDALAHRACDAIFAVNGTQYKVGASTEILYPAAGCSDDWAMGGAGIDIVLTFELPGGGSSGFDLPPGRILPVVTETWEGIKVIAEYVKQKKIK